MEQRFKLIDHIIAQETEQEKISQYRSETCDQCDGEWGIKFGEFVEDGECRCYGKSEHIEHTGQKHTRIAERADVCNGIVCKFCFRD